MTDSVFINVPVSSPLHPQTNLPFLKSFLADSGFDVTIFDTNIAFFRWMLRDHDFNIKDGKYTDNPVEMLSLYNSIEKTLSEKCAKFSNLDIGLRNIGMKYNRLVFTEVLAALEDGDANPFIEFYTNFITEKLVKLNPRIVGISIIFQDQIIAAFTLAKLLRAIMPSVKIVMGGQMITRCYDTIVKDGVLDHLWDYLVCWDGELPLLDIHNKVIRGLQTNMRNTIDNGKQPLDIRRDLHGFELNELSSVDFTDLDFSEYLFPEMLVPLQTARGCYGSCEFCAIPYGSNAGFRERTVDKIVDDICAVQRHTLEKYGRKATYFKFMDDTSSPATLLALSKEIEARGVEVYWETFVRLEKMFQQQGVMDQLYRGGCRKLMWGLETNDPDVLKDMNKKITPDQTTNVLKAAAHAGILNFAFVLIGFPTETSEQRERLAEYIINNPDIHVLTIATFDLTKRSKIQEKFKIPNPYGLEVSKARGFEVRLPYTVHGSNWKEKIVPEAQRMLVKIIEKRPDIGFMSLFPDQVRMVFCNKYGNDWGRRFLSDFGEDNIRQLLLNTEKYIDSFYNSEEIDLSGLPEPVKREHLRTREDIEAITEAIQRRKQYQTKRIKHL